MLFQFNHYLLGGLAVAGLRVARSSAGSSIGLLRALEMLEVALAVDTARLAEGTKSFGKGTETAIHDTVFFQRKSLSVFYTMKVVHYRTSVDPDVDYSATDFADEVAIYLADPDGWGKFYTFVVSPRGKHIRLCRPRTLKTEGCKDDQLSCAVLGGEQIWLNHDRWMKGSKASGQPLERYRQYMVSHEMGHSLGYDHVKCPNSGPAPIMMQQTLGIGKCSPNTKLTEVDLRAKK